MSLRRRWQLKHRPVWARFAPRRVWVWSVLATARFVPWSYAYRYRVERGW